MEELNNRPKILINSVPKSGTHLLMQIILGIPGMVYMKANNDSYVFYNGIRQEVASIVNGSVALGHMSYHESLPPMMESAGIRHLFISRDPRDVAVSYMHFIKKQYPEHPLHRYFNVFLQNDEQRLQALISGVRLEGDAAKAFGFSTFPSVREEFETIYQWRGKPHLCEIKYEDLVKNETSQANEIYKVIQFLWNDLSRLQMSKEQLFSLMKGSIDPANCWTFRKGKIGGWTEVFTAQHIDSFKQNDGEFLIELGYERDLNW